LAGNAPFAGNKSGVRLSVRLTPKARHVGVHGIAPDANGNTYLKAGVSAPAEGGKANRALIKLLARELGLPASIMVIATGAAARHKSIQIAGDTAEIKKRLELLCGELEYE